MVINYPTKSLQEREAEQDPGDNENTPGGQNSTRLLHNWLKDITKCIQDMKGKRESEYTKKTTEIR